MDATKGTEACAREASQIMGDSACVREGKGRTVERLCREVRVNAVGGGSEEVPMNVAVDASFGKADKSGPRAHARHESRH